MAGAVSQARNTIFPSLILMYEKLQKLGLVYEDEQVVYVEPELEVRDVRTGYATRSNPSCENNIPSKELNLYLFIEMIRS